MISLLATVTFMFSSCDNDDSSDTTKPLIELHEPEEGQALEIGNEHGVHFEMDLSDDVMLKSYKIEIHSNFDHHSHGGNSRAAQETVDFSFNRSYDVSGQKTAHIHHHDIVIPANATAGDYHLMVYCTDAAGNESHIARNIKLSNEVEDNVAGFYQSGSDIKTFAVNSDMTMSYQLTSLAAAIGQAKTVNYIVHSSFQKNEQVFTCNNFLFFGLNEGNMELTF